MVWTKSSRMSTKPVYAALLPIISLLIFSACGGGGGVSTPPSSNPVPVITSLSPSTLIVGAAATTVTVNGTGFMQTSTVQWNQNNRTATFVSSTQLQVGLTATDLAATGTGQVVVINPSPGGGASNSMTLAINNPSPQISGVSPSTVTTAAAGSTLTITGTGFVATSTVTWNGANHAASFVSSTQLTLTLQAGDVAAVGSAQVAVVNPTPGGGTSSAAALAINNPSPQISGIAPSTVTTAAAGSTLTITGTGFVPTSTVTWNSATHAATFVSSTQLTLTLQASDVAAVGSAQVAVVNPAPGGGTTPANSVAIVYPVPVISSLSPTSVIWGTSSTLLTVNGSGFAPSSVVLLAGVNHATTYVNSSTLTLTLSASDLGSGPTLSVTVSTGSPGGGTSAPATLAITSPTLTISAVNPSTVLVNSPDTYVDVFGTGFTASTTVQVNGSTLIPGSWNSANLFITIPASDLTAVGTLSLTANDPANGASNTVTISVNPNPIPILSGISPVSAAIGGAAFTLTVNGSNFAPTSVVQWNGSARPTTYGSSATLTATISASDIVSLGNSTVTVSTPTPGGGVSTAITFTAYLGLSSNDLIYDPTRKLLWASVPSSAGPPLGNSVVSIDPYTGVLGTPIWAGSEPNKLAISGDGTMLWVGFLGTPSVGKVDLTTQTLTPVTLYFPGGWGSNVYASSLAVVPGSPSSVAVAAGGVGIYDDATERTNSSNLSATYLAFGANASTLYGFSSDLSLFTVDSTGIASAATLGSTNTYSYDLRYDNGRLYLTSGQILDGATGNLVGTFSQSGPVAPDSSLGRAFVLGSSVGFSPDQITAFDENTFVPIGSFPVAGLQTSGTSPTSLVRWGEDGVAFRVPQQIYILQSPVVKDLSASATDVAVSVSAPSSATTGTTMPITITVTNNGPNAATNVVLIDAFSANASFISAQPSQGSCGVTPIVVCDFGTIANGAAATLTLSVQALMPGTLTNTSTVNATQPDANQSNNTAGSSTTVTGTAYNPVPIVSSLSPQSALAGSTTFTLTVNGSAFTSGSTVAWNGTSLPTTYVSATQLTATVDASLIASRASAQVSVSNNAPGGGVSGSLPFSVFQIIALDTNDIVFEPFTRLLFASLPSTATQLTGNSIVSIDPLTGTLSAPVFIGSEPTRLAVSDDGQYLYVVLSGSNAVRRMALATLTPGTQFSTVSAVFGSSFAASDLAVMPGDANVLATVGYSDGIQVWDVTNAGASARPLTASRVNDVYEGSVLAWGDAINLYSNDEGLSPSQLHRFVVGNTSFAETDATYLDMVGGKITFSGGLLFSDFGGVADPSPAPPSTPRLVAKLGSGGGSSTADTSINRAFFLNSNDYGVNSRTISAFDTTRFTPAGSVELDGLTGDAFDLIRWGAEGLAFRTAIDFWGNGSGRIVLVQGSSVLPLSSTPNPAPSISGISPGSITSPAGNTWITVTGSNLVPGAVVQWGGAARSTKFVNSGALSVAIPATDLATPATIGVQVVNPPPGGGSSNVFNVTVN